ncbi:MAG: hypothetical protein QME70_07100 [Bacillota bacterium]|nr:hypothetical protein [Bacillota bacterium]
MAHAYTPGLKVTEYAVIRRQRRLPIPGRVLVERGQRVGPDAVVAEASLPGNPNTVNAAAALGADPSDLPHLMVKKVGDPVRKGEVIARYRALFGLVSSKCTSPVDGAVESVSEVTGQVIVREPPIPVQVRAYLEGAVAEVIPREGVVVESQGAFIQGIFGVGGETYGEIQVVVANPEEVLEASAILPAHRGKVLVGGSLVTGAALRRAVEVGARGVVAGGIIDRDLIGFLGHDIGVAITGHEDIPITVIVTEGFGQMTMAHRTFELLQSLGGRMASINGATQIRAGVMRPEIVVPVSRRPSAAARPAAGSTSAGDAASGGRASAGDAASSGLTSAGQAGSGGVSQGLVPGTRIRIIREPYFGRLAHVTELPPELQVIETEAKVRILHARLDSGELVTVPRANVEIIED